MAAHICVHPKASCHRPWNSRVVSLVWPLLASHFSTRRFGDGVWMLLQAFVKLYIPHMPKFVCQFSAMAETIVKQRAFPLSCSSPNIGTMGHPAIFRAINTTSLPRAGFRQTMVRLAEKLAPIAFRQFPPTLCYNGLFADACFICRFVWCQWQIVSLCRDYACAIWQNLV